MTEKSHQEKYKSKKVAMMRAKQLWEDNDFVVVLKSVSWYWVELRRPELVKGERIIATFWDILT